MVKNMILLKKDAQLLLNCINDWVFQFYEDAKPMFSLLPKFKNSFPQNCFYTGKVYRKQSKDAGCPNELVACSKEKGCNGRISIFKLNPRYYESTCINGFDLYEIVLFLINTFNLTEPEPRYGDSLLERLNNEKEVICKMNKKDFKRENVQKSLNN